MTHVEEIVTLNTSNGFLTDIFTVLRISKDCFIAGKSFRKKTFGGCGGQVVSMLAFYSDNPSLNPADVFSFFCKICV